MTSTFKLPKNFTAKESKDGEVITLKYKGVVVDHFDSWGELWQ